MVIQIYLTESST